MEEDPIFHFWNQLFTIAVCAVCISLYGQQDFKINLELGHFWNIHYPITPLCVLMLKQTFTTPKMIMHEHFQIDRTQNASINNSRFKIDSNELQEDFVIQNSFHTWFQLSWAQKPVMQNRSNARCAFSLLHTNIQISNVTISKLQKVFLLFHFT